MSSRFQRRPASKSRKAPPPAHSIELLIDELGGRGDGLARYQGELVFVPFTVAGDRVLARIDARRGEGLSAHLVQVLEPGSARQDAPCPHYGSCGGCTVQHVADSSYQEWKRGLLLTPLVRQGIDPALVQPLVSIPVGQRRRANFAFSRRRNTIQLGFHGRASHSLVDVQECLQLHPTMVALLPALRDMLCAIVPAGEEGDVVLMQTENGLDLLVEAEARLDLFDREKLAAFAEAQNLARLSWRRPGNSMIDPIARRQPATVRFGNHGVEPAPGGFLQPTQAGEQAIAARILEAVQGAKRVADLYCGCGSFTLPLAAAGHQVHGVEGDELALRSLQAASNAHSLNITTELRDLSRRPLLPHELKNFDALIFDPPRAGAAAQAEQLAVAGPACLVAVSCNPATLSRDLRLLLDGGYHIRSITPIDQFPHAAHLESLVVLYR